MSSATSELLPDPATPVTHVSTPFSIRTERLHRLLVVAFSMRERVVEGSAAAARRGDLVVERARRRRVSVQQVVETAAKDQLAASVAGARADVDNPVRPRG